MSYSRETKLKVCLALEVTLVSLLQLESMFPCICGGCVQHPPTHKLLHLRSPSLHLHSRPRPTNFARAPCALHIQPLSAYTLIVHSACAYMPDSTIIMRARPSLYSEVPSTYTLEEVMTVCIQCRCMCNGHGDSCNAFSGEDCNCFNNTQTFCTGGTCYLTQVCHFHCNGDYCMIYPW